MLLVDKDLDEEELGGEAQHHTGMRSLGVRLETLVRQHGRPEHGSDCPKPPYMHTLVEDNITPTAFLTLCQCAFPLRSRGPNRRTRRRSASMQLTWKAGSGLRL